MDNFDITDDDILEFPEEKLPNVMEHLRKISDFLGSCEVSYLVEKYKHYFPPVDGTYSLSYSHISKLNDYLVSDTLQELVSMGLVETSWDDEKNDFVFFTNIPSGNS